MTLGEVIDAVSQKGHVRRSILIVVRTGKPAMSSLLFQPTTSAVSACHEPLERSPFLGRQMFCLLVEPIAYLTDVQLGQTSIPPGVEFHPMQIGDQGKGTEPCPVTIVNDPLTVEPKLVRLFLGACESFKRGGGVWRGPPLRPRRAPLP